MDETGESRWPLPRIWCGFLIALLTVTFRLWIVHSEVPAVAMFNWVSQVPRPVLWLPVIGIAVGCVLVVIYPRRFQAAWWMIALGLGTSFLFDQHRLQPWAYQTAIYACVFACFSDQQIRRMLIPLAASVYIYSAAGKLDYQFAHSVGQDFLRIPLNLTGMDSISNTTKAKLALGFPVAELVAGLLLLVDRTRRLGGVLVAGIHISLLMLLGPWGMNHSNGVLLWNLALLVQAYFLFIAPETEASRDNKSLYRELFRLPQRNVEQKSWLVPRLFAWCLVLIGLVAPATERMGIWDHWTSWALYSPHNSRVDVQFHRTVISELPKSAQGHLAEDDDQDGWHELILDEWSLESLAVPVYPQARYQLAFVRELVVENEIEPRAVRCRVKGISSRMNGTRSETPLLGLNEIQQALGDYWLVSNE